jgi:LuxR family maltose regulon positive regulatory protein
MTAADEAKRVTHTTGRSLEMSLTSLFHADRTLLVPSSTLLRVPRSALVDRPIVDALSAYDDVPVIHVSAARDWGKSIALKSWAAHRVSLGDVVMWREPRPTRRSHDDNSMTDSALEDYAHDNAELLVSVTGEIGSDDSPVRIIIDDAELSDLEAENLLDTVTSNPLMQLVVASRHEPHVIRRAVERGIGMVTFTENDLRMTGSEILIRAQRQRIPLTLRAADHVSRALMGWPVLVQRVLSELREARWGHSGPRRSDIDAAIDAAMMAQVKRYRAHEGFNALVAYALVDVISDEVREVIGDSAILHQLLEWVEIDGFGRRKNVDGRECIELTPPFRAAIVRSAANEAGGVGLGILSFTLAEKVAESGDSAHAARIALRGRRWKAAATYLSRVPMIGADGIDATVAYHLEDIPLSSAVGAPVLALGVGMNRWAAGDQAAGRMLVTAAVEMLDSNVGRPDDGPVPDDHDTSVADLESLADDLVLVVGLRVLGRAVPAGERAAALAHRLSSPSLSAVRTRFPEFVASAMAQSLAAMVFGSSPGRLMIEETWLECTTLVAKEHVYALGLMALTRAAEGRLSEARGYLDQFQAIADDHGLARSDQASAPGVLAESWILEQEHNVAASRSALELVNTQSLSLPEIAQLAQLVDARLAFRESGAPRSLLVATSGSIKGLPFTDSLWFANRFDMLVADSRVLEAVELHATRAADNPRDSIGAVSRARTKLLVGEYEDARLVATSDLRAEGFRVVDRARLLIIAAAASAFLGRHDDARRHFDDAVWLCLTHGLSEPFTDMPVNLRGEFEAPEIAGPDWRCAETPHMAAVPRKPIRLTSREQVILQALLEEPRSSVIADRLHVSGNTVKSQMRSLYKKLGVHSRSDALTVASSMGLM